jgi:hypothetical protein
MFAEFDTRTGLRSIYSHGRHFAVAEYIAKPHGRARPFFLLNGDAVSVTTSRHQEEIRSALSAARRDYWPEIETVIIPYSALESAGIDRLSIIPHEVYAEEFIRETVAVAHISGVPLHARTIQRWIPASEYDGDSMTRLSSRVAAQENEIYISRDIEPDSDGLYRFTRHIHRLGECVFTARDASGRRRKYLSGFDHNEAPALYFLAMLPRTPARTVAAALDSLAPAIVHAAYARDIPVYRQGDIFAIETTLTDSDVYGLARTRARLTLWSRAAKPRAGEVGYIAPTTVRRRVRAEYRKNRAWRNRTLTTAKTPAVPTMETQTVYSVERLGDGLVQYCERLLEYRALRKRLAPYAPANMPRAYARLEHARKRLETARKSYRFWRNDMTHIVARDGERRERVRQANRDAGRAMRVAAHDAISLARRDVTASDGDALRAALSVYGTAHTATEVVTTRDGRVYLRGIMRHEPRIEPNAGRWRERDHKNVHLGDGSQWYLAVRNTVPRNRGRGGDATG